MSAARRTLVAGVDSSTQSTKVLLVDAADGAVVGAASAPHPAGTEVDPAAWWDALNEAGRDLLDGAAAVAVAGQQHGLVALDEADAVVRSALLWNDLRSAAQADDLVAELGGPARCAEQTGSLLTASFTVTKLRWVAEHEPEAASRIAVSVLPHDWLTWRLIGSPAASVTTDAGDASGTGYFRPSDRTWLPDVARAAVGHDLDLPRLAEPAEVVGHTVSGSAVAAGTGDNMAAALGLDLIDGDIVVSIGTSGTAFGVSPSARADPSGAVAGFCDARGSYLPLVCTINASGILSTVSRLLGCDHDAFDRLALDSPPGANGVHLLPYLDGERTPNRPDATGLLAGLTSATVAADLARAAVEALLCSLADAVDALGIEARRILMIGGGSRSAAVRRLAPSFLGAPVVVPEAGEYVALGAARQATWALAGTAQPPSWPAPAGTEHAASSVEVSAAAAVRSRYGDLRDRTAP